MVLKMEDYELVKIDSVSNIISPVEEKLYDITVDGDHTFFIKLPESEDFFLMHNCDGNHITSMLIGWFRRFAPNLFDEGRICKLVTPLILVKDEQIRNALNIIGIVLQHNASWEHSFKLFDKIRLKFVFQHKQTSFLRNVKKKGED